MASKVASMDFGERETEETLRATTRGNMSPQQFGVVEWVQDGQGSAFVEAVAGSGKTYTLRESAPYMKGSVSVLAFNKKIADELKTKMAALAHVRVGTFHSFGLAAWKKLAPHVRVDADAKRRGMYDALSVPYPLRGAVGKLVSLGKQSMVGMVKDADDEAFWIDLIEHYDILLGVEGAGEGDKDIDDEVTEKLIDYARAGITYSLDTGRQLIDFDDMLWLPLVNNAPFWKNDWVLVDEAQDTNLARRMMAERMLKPGGRALWVGDRHQSIYGFTGADADAVDQIVEHFKCTLLPLTVTFRVSKEATKLAQKYVPEIEAHDDNLPGKVVRVKAGAFDTWIDPDHKDVPKPGDAVLCRNTRPLISLAFRLLSLGIGCHVEGRDIGASLSVLAGKWKVDSTAALATNLEAYRERETEKLVARGAEMAIDALNDKIGTLFAIMEGCDTVQEVKDKINMLFRDTETGEAKRTVTLSTVHKAKGREWNRVIILGYGTYMPSRRATQPWQKVQESNLIYVAVTRTKDELVLTD